MNIHILGIAGTFMGGIALIATKLGHTITGQDTGIYPPMSEQLTEQDITYTSGYVVADMPKADIYIIGNALSRGNPCVEHILTHNLPYTSAPQWLGEHVLREKWVIAVSGTHGKTTTASLISHILEQLGYHPSYLIGGIAKNFAVSARITKSMFFVIEADEYDTAFFDKRSKFIHYFPNTLIINNLEFDHADIFDSLLSIQTQFHHLLRTLPESAHIIYPNDTESIDQVLEKGVYSHTHGFNTPTFNQTAKGLEFMLKGQTFHLPLLGEHNVHNATSAILACHNAGMKLEDIATALTSFTGVKRRMEVRYHSEKLTIYDDFAHHPTSIALTLAGLRNTVGNSNIIVALELRSNTMKTGMFNEQIASSVALADKVLVLEHLIPRDNVTTYKNVDDMIHALKNTTGHLVVMSNGSFNDFIPKLLSTLT